MANNCFARAALLALPGLVGMSLGCDQSPTGPTRPAAPTVAVVSQSPGLTVSAISPAAGLSGEETWVSGTGFLPGATVVLGGMSAFVRNVNPSGTLIVMTNPVRAAGPVDVVVTNPGGQTGTLAGGYTFVSAEVFSGMTLTAGPSVITAGGQLTTNWMSPSGRGCNGGGDWLALFKVGDPDLTGAANGHSNLWFAHLCGTTSGSYTFTVPTQAGQYEIRYMVGDTSVKHSGPVTVN